MKIEADAVEPPYKTYPAPKLTEESRATPDAEFRRAAEEDGLRQVGMSMKEGDAAEAHLRGRRRIACPTDGDAAEMQRGGGFRGGVGGFRRSQAAGGASGERLAGRIHEHRGGGDEISRTTPPAADHLRAGRNSRSSALRGPMRAKKYGNSKVSRRIEGRRIILRSRIKRVLPRPNRTDPVHEDEGDRERRMSDGFSSDKKRDD